jgi:LuxR family maltose regulon positive regulatory protein
VEQLLATKLFIPPIRPGLVIRPRLVERLSAGLYRKLALISAPAGFGKTTLVTEWLDNFRLDAKEEEQIPIKVAWLSLHEDDNDLARFLTYFVAALKQIEGIGDTFGEEALSMLQSPQPPSTETILTSLINEITAIPDQLVFVLDDYHLIEDQTIHDALSFLLEHQPPQLHLVIATREDPLLPLARLRAKDQLTELRAGDLRFIYSETADFLNRVMGLDLSVEDIIALEGRTEGWIAGLQLAAISMRGHTDAFSFIQSFAGSNRLVLDYLIEEVLNQQPPEVQNFLMQTAVLNRLTGALCDAVTGQEDGQAILEILERTNIFIIHLDSERRWYRYHHLFADLLQQRLYQTRPEEIPTLHSRASEWYEHHGFVDEAIEHALRCGDFERAVNLIEVNIDALWGLGEHRKLHRWLDELPEDLLLSKPSLSIFQARLQCARGQLDAAERTLNGVEQRLAPSADHGVGSELQKQISLSNSEKLKLRGRAAATKALICSYQGNVSGIIKFAHQALDYLPEHDQIWRGLTASVLGNAHGFKGDMRAAYEARFEALQACKDVGNVYLVMLANLQLAITLRAQGQLQRTIEICRQQMQIAIELGMSQTRLTGYLLAVWGETLAELNDLEGALDRAKKGFQLTERSRDLQMIGWSFMCLIRILFSSGDLVEVEKTLHKMEEFARESLMPPWVTNQMTAWKARLWLAQGKLENAIQWIRERDLSTDGKNKPQQEIDFFSLFDYLVLARIRIANGQLQEAIGLLDHLLVAAEAGGRIEKVIEIKILQALTFQAGGETDRALSRLKQALALAEPEGFIRIFVDEGPPMVRLLHEALGRGIAPQYTHRLLAAFSLDEPEQADTTTYHTDQSGLIEPLSERELEVLALIAEGCTNQEIASRLFLSLNTVKVHTRNIYGKLGTNNRTQASAKARELGILHNLLDA